MIFHKNNLKKFEKSINWIVKFTAQHSGISATSRKIQPYPEVTGYFIPSLIDWGELSLAKQYTDWIMLQQDESGAWADPYSGRLYAFDTGQITRGLFSFYLKSGHSEKLEESLLLACSWMVSKIGEDGAPNVPDIKNWGKNVPHGILLYAYEPVKRVAEYFKKSEWVRKIEKLEKYYLSNEQLTDFNHLSHFHAYIMEALCDLGYFELAKLGMHKIESIQSVSGAVPAYSNVRWVCSTGLFQYAIVWFKLGDMVRGNKAFEYALRLQNLSGGWNGGYGFLSKYIPARILIKFLPTQLVANYFPRAEISWAVKYFLDALRYKIKYSFDKQAPNFIDAIDKTDGRYKLLLNTILLKKPNLILDVGCGKGRYLKNLLEDVPEAKLYGVDLSLEVMKDLPNQVEQKQGSLTNLPYSNQSFDLVFACESLEHCINLNGAINELERVIKPGGALIVIDKNSKIRTNHLSPWEQWFDSNKLKEILVKKGFTVKVVDNIPYDGKVDRLFSAWIAVKN